MSRLDQKKTPLFDAIKKYVDDKVVPFHVPGHKQGKGIPELSGYLGERVLQMDVNGMEDLDYLSNPTGVILESQKLLAEACNADNAYFLVNGTTSGVQAMIMSICEPGDKIIIPRNVHKSAISGVILSNAIPVYIQPEINEELGIAMGVAVEVVKKAIEENPDAKAIFIINPTYYGVVSDIKSIVRIAHNRGMSVIVDEAHGAHLPFHTDFPLSAMEAGADMSAASFHKTSGSLTQSSVLLVRGSSISHEKVKQVLNLISTTSASYILMCSIDVARKQLATCGYDMLDKTLQLVRWARDEINKIQGIYAFGKELVGSPGCFSFDETKLGINFKGLGLTGYMMESKLRKEYNIQIELSDLFNILAITSIGDRKEDLEALINALRDIALKGESSQLNNMTMIPHSLRMVVSPREAFYSSKRMVTLDEAVGEVAGEMVMAYPPGIPIICMGEEITKDIVEYIRLLKKEKCQLQGTSDPYANYIKVLAKGNRDISEGEWR